MSNRECPHGRRADMACIHCMGLSQGQTKPDARVTAAAPAMLGALRLAWAAMIQAGLDKGGAFRAVEKAIAEAEGRSA